MRPKLAAFWGLMRGALSLLQDNTDVKFFSGDCRALFL
jgi:hypothetical protein